MNATGKAGGGPWGWILPLLVGAALAAAKLASMFLPGLLLADLLIFGPSAAVLAAWRPDGWWKTALLQCVVPVALVLYLSVGLGAAQVARGVGIAWPLSLLTMPAASLLGGLLGVRLQVRRART